MNSVQPISSSDRRRAPRRTCNLQITISTDTGAVCSGVTIDVNEFGMAAIVEGDLMIGEIIRIQFEDPDADGEVTVKESAVRAWDGRHAGFEFLRTMKVAREGAA